MTRASQPAGGSDRVRDMAGGAFEGKVALIGRIDVPATNLRGAYLVARSVIPHTRRQPNVGSWKRDLGIGQK